jgi:hypothetical protein
MPDDLDFRLKLRRIDRRIGKLASERTSLLLARAKDEGFTPCDDCCGGFCSMNCSSAPTYLQIVDLA